MESNRRYSDEEEMLFSQLEVATNDPVTEKCLQAVRQAEEAINLSPEDKRNYAQIIAELDRNWPHINTPMLVTGEVWLFDPLEEDPVRSFSEDIPVYSYGFKAVQNFMMTDEEPSKDSYIKICHAFIKSDQTTGAKQYGFAELDKVAIEYSFVSDEATENRLRHFHPDVINDLDFRALNCNDEIEAIEMLSDFEVDLTEDQKGNLDDLPQCVIRYLQKILEFDKELPYKMSVHDQIFIKYSQGETIPETLAEPKHGLAKVNGLTLLPKPKGYGWDENIYVLGLDLTMMGANKHKASRDFVVPLHNLSDVESIRIKG